MAFTLHNLADHPDADLLAMIARNTAELNRAGLAIRKRHDEAVRVVGRFCKEWTATDDLIAQTPARTLDGLLSKASYALHDHKPGKASRVTGAPRCRRCTTCFSCCVRLEPCQSPRPSLSSSSPVCSRC